MLQQKKNNIAIESVFMRNGGLGDKKLYLADNEWSETLGGRPEVLRAHVHTR